MEPVRSIEELWHVFMNQAHPGIDEQTLQYREMRLAFYFGALGLLGEIHSMGASDHAEPAEQLHEWHDEIQRFVAGEPEVYSC